MPRGSMHVLANTSERTKRTHLKHKLAFLSLLFQRLHLGIGHPREVLQHSLLIIQFLQVLCGLPFLLVKLLQLTLS